MIFDDAAKVFEGDYDSCVSWYDLSGTWELYRNSYESLPDRMAVNHMAWESLQMDDVIRDNLVSEKTIVCNPWIDLDRMEDRIEWFRNETPDECVGLLMGMQILLVESGRANHEVVMYEEGYPVSTRSVRLSDP